VKRTRRYIIALAVVALIVASNTIAALAALQPRLGTATSFVVLAAAGITNAGPTTVTGDVGTFPTITETGFGPGANSVTILSGTNHAGDAVTQGARNAEVTAYNDLANQTPCPVFGFNPGSLDGRTLTPGCYKFSSSAILNVGQTLTLNGFGTYVFQIGSALTIGNGSTVLLINGAQACGVFWQVTSSATIGTAPASFQGTLVAGTSISVNTGAVWTGRALAGALDVSGAVTLLSNTIAIPPANCAALPTVGAAATPTPAVSGAPGGGGGPLQNDSFPWLLALAAGVLASAGAVGLGLTIRGHLRSIR
jgi:ice-binding like protein